MTTSPRWHVIEGGLIVDDVGDRLYVLSRADDRRRLQDLLNREQTQHELAIVRLNEANEKSAS